MTSEIGATWTSLSPYHAQLIAFVLTTAAAITGYYLRPKVKLIWGRTNNSFHQHKTETGPVNIYAEKLYVQNSGRKSAEKVEVVLSSAPSDLAIYPPRSFERKESPDGSYILNFPFIAPFELIILDTLHINTRTAEIVSVHCPEAVGRRVDFWVARRYKPAFYRLLGLLVLVGAFYSIEVAIRVLAFIIGRQP